jgi:hypothetical protein
MNSGFTLWTTGSIYKKYRGSLEKLTTERVSSIFGRWIQDGRPRSYPEGERENRRPSIVDRRRRHGRNHPNLAGVQRNGISGHHSSNGRYREGEQDMASSPHTRGKSDDGLRTVPSSGWWRRVPVNMVKQDELMRNNKRRLSSFGNMTRSLEAGL